MSSLTLENEAYVELLRYGGMLLVKLILMSPLTSLFRFIFKSFASEEDCRFLARNNPERREQLMKKDPNVERVSVIRTSASYPWNAKRIERHPLKMN